MLRNTKAIEAFKKTLSRSRTRRYQFTAPNRHPILMLEGVRVNVRLDAFITETTFDEVECSGGCVLFVASASRSNIESRRKSVAALIRWTLEITNPNIEVLPRLCMSIDVFGETITRASSSVDRFRRQVKSACSEAAAVWSRVTPPAGYDGPNWR